MKTNLSETELKTILDRIYVYISIEDFKEAIILFSQIIDNRSSDDINLPFLLYNRASVFSKIQDWNSAIDDIQRCISISPDEVNYYLNMGVFITWKQFYSGNFRIDGTNEDLKKSIYYYKECLKRDPTYTVAWLNTIETYLYLKDWDYALSYLGMSKAYLNSKEDRLICAWLSCLTLALAGDPLIPGDLELCRDESIQYESGHDYQQIDCVISELERTHYHHGRVCLAKEIHQLYKKHLMVK